MQVESSGVIKHGLLVTDKGAAKTDTKTESKMGYASRVDGLAFSWTNVTYDYAALDTILLVKNTSSTKKLIIDSISMASDTATLAVIHFPACSVVTGTSVTGLNLNKSSGNVAEATAVSDETTNSQGDIYHNVYLEALKTKEHLTGDAIVLGQGDCIAIDFVTDGGAAYCSVEGYFTDEVI